MDRADDYHSLVDVIMSEVQATFNSLLRCSSIRFEFGVCVSARYDLMTLCGTGVKLCTRLCRTFKRWHHTKEGPAANIATTIHTAKERKHIIASQPSQFKDVNIFPLNN